MSFTKSISISVVSLFIGFFLLELSLKVAIPDNESIEDIPDLPKLDQPLDIVTDTRSQKCYSKFYAIFKKKGGEKCVSNPTSQLAIYGPPDYGWFEQGFFEISEDMFSNTKLCSCLSGQVSFVQEDSNIEAPVMEAVFNGTKINIDKWVCDSKCK